MIVRKIQYNLKRTLAYLKFKVGLLNLNIVIGAFFYVFLILVLSINGYTAYSRGIENLQRLDIERQRTALLEQENNELKDLYKYYSSIDYKKIYARDNLNLAERGETLYYIEKHEEIDIDKLETIKPDSIDNITLWRKLIFGV